MKRGFLKYAIIILSTLVTISCSGSGHEDEDDPDHDHDHDHEQAEHHENGAITFKADKASEFGIEIEEVAAGDFNDVIKTTGTIETAGTDLYTITAKKSGILTLASGITRGMTLSSGQRIATVSSSGMEGGDVNQAAVANLQKAKAEYERLKPLYEEGLVTAADFREAERAYNEAHAISGGGSAGTAAVVSPAEGVLQELYVNSGEYVDAGAPVGVVSKNSRLTLKADLPSRESRHLPDIVSANIVTEGGETLRLDEMSGRLISGGAMTAQNGYIPVYFSFQGNALSFPGGFADVYLLCGPRKGVVSIPRESLVEIQGNKYVYVKTGADSYDKKLVTLGSSDGQRVEVLSGLNPGDSLVAKGAAVIRMAEISSIAPPAHTHNH